MVLNIFLLFSSGIFKILGHLVSQIQIGIRARLYIPASRLSTELDLEGIVKDPGGILL